MFEKVVILEEDDQHDGFNSEVYKKASKCVGLGINSGFLSSFLLSFFLHYYLLLRSHYEIQLSFIFNSFFFSWDCSRWAAHKYKLYQGIVLKASLWELSSLARWEMLEKVNSWRKGRRFSAWSLSNHLLAEISLLNEYR